MIDLETAEAFLREHNGEIYYVQQGDKFYIAWDSRKHSEQPVSGKGILAAVETAMARESGK